MAPGFDDAGWPRAYEYLDQDVGIVGVPGYWRFPEAFIGSRWIWTVSLVFDNTVLLRKTEGSTRHPGSRARRARLSGTSRNESEPRFPRSRLGALLAFGSHRSGRDDGWSGCQTIRV
jgi:hypothetical protein